MLNRIIGIAISALFMTFAILSCDSGPKVIEGNNNGTNSNLVRDPNAQGGATNSQEPSGGVHEIVVKEVLDTDKYSYLKVNEKEKEYWVAILKREVEIGKTYFFEGGLLKRNFYSQEYDRIFETVYLVSGIWDKSGKEGSSSGGHQHSNNDQKVDLEVGNIQLAEGAVKIDDILKKKEEYGGKKVKVTGKCVKMNPNIMNRNWVHLSDGTSDRALVITTNEKIALGSVVNLEGTISIDRDFGAGYRYDIIMESAELR